MTKKKATVETVDAVRASRGGHTFHERWAARRALQLVFPQDRLKAIAVEGLSTSETIKPGAAAEEIADLVLYYGDGESFATSEVVQTAQFKYKTTPGAVTASYLRKTIEKFAGSIIGVGTFPRFRFVGRPLRATTGRSLKSGFDQFRNRGEFPVSPLSASLGSP